MFMANFSQDISSWDVSKINGLNGMFIYQNFNQDLNQHINRYGLHVSSNDTLKLGYSQGSKKAHMFSIKIFLVGITCGSNGLYV